MIVYSFTKLMLLSKKKSLAEYLKLQKTDISINYNLKYQKNENLYLFYFFYFSKIC